MKQNIFALFAALLAFVIFTSCETAGSKAPKETFTVKLESVQYKIGEAEVRLKPSMGLGKLKDVKVPVFYFPEEDAVVLKFMYEFTTFHQCWSRSGRQSFIDAVPKYKEDYDSRALARGKKTKRSYGLVFGYVLWQTVKIAVHAHANMNVELGYTFVGGAPYFVANQLRTEYISNVSRSFNRSGPIIPMYFTGPQAEKMAEIFEQAGKIDGEDSLNTDSIRPF